MNSEHLVTVAAFSHAVEAHIHRGRLEAAGISAYIRDEHVVSANWLYSNAIGGVKLQVRAADLERAEGILRQDDSTSLDSAQAVQLWSNKNDEDAQPTGPRCPNCQRREVYYEKFDRRWVFLSILLLGIPLPFLSRTWRCDHCGYSWKLKLFR